ncbi:MAG: hypothetical protein JXB26_12575 [Candidatus Aminicenantes bacterium]|nr:hypothetical protein [Candidatus Aminicenantes bacterium]
MFKGKKYPSGFFAVLLVFLVGTALFINIRGLQHNFLFADEAIYYSMTQSLARDGDLEYTRKDLVRYFQDLGSEPAGIFLKKGKNDKIFFAKAFAYPLFAAPFVRIFGINGFFVFHALMFFGLLVLGYAFLERHNKPSLSLAAPATFFLASVAYVYFFWISPDFFNLFLVFCVLFLCLYKHTSEEDKDGRPAGRLRRFLLSDASDFTAVFLAGIAIFSKPPNIALLGPIVLHTLIKKRWLKALLIVFICLVTSGLFWLVNHTVTGDWNYQGGNRKEFFGPYPLEKENLTFDSITKNVAVMTSEGYAKKHLLPLNLVFPNLFYYFFGRFTGIVWYFFPALLALILFFAGGRKRPYQWFLLIALAGEILIYLILMPDNYGGGGGALANRYFLNIFPFFFFLPAPQRRTKELAVCWLAAALLIGPILANPLRHSHYPATHAKKLPFKLFPVELTLSNNFPTNTNPKARVELGPGDSKGRYHFLDDNFHPRHDMEPGIWTRGPHTAEVVLKTYFPVKKIVFHLHNNPRLRNTITVKFQGEKKKVVLGSKQNAELTFTPKKGFRMGKWIHLYTFKIRAEKGSIPYFEDKKSDERRYLGVRFYPELFREE